MLIANTDFDGNLKKRDYINGIMELKNGYCKTIQYSETCETTLFNDRCHSVKANVLNSLHLFHIITPKIVIYTMVQNQDDNCVFIGTEFLLYRNDIVDESNIFKYSVVVLLNVLSSTIVKNKKDIDMICKKQYNDAEYRIAYDTIPFLKSCVLHFPIKDDVFIKEYYKNVIKKWDSVFGL